MTEKSMNKVYFLKDREQLFSVCKDFFEKIYTKNKPLLIKIGFSGSGNKFSLNPVDIKPIVAVAREMNMEPILIDTPIAPIAYHRSAEESVSGVKKVILKILNNLNIQIIPNFIIRRRYEKIIKEKGFSKLAQFKISNSFGEVIKAKDINVEICKDFTEADNILVVSRAKGHYCCGFSGAIKNLAMGMVSTKTKKEGHFFAASKIIQGCNRCGKCIRACPGKAISMSGGKIKIDIRKCFYCSICQTECPNKCLIPAKAIFDELLAQTAITVFKNLPKNIFFINFATNITKGCDCVPTSPIISGDVGILFSSNPALVDRASVDLINKLNGRNIFFEENRKDPYLQINYALKYGGFDENYDLINL